MGIFIPDPTRPHLRYPWDFAREARMQNLRARLAALRRWEMTMARPRDVETAHKLLVETAAAAKADVMGRLESGDRDWDGLRRAVTRYIDMQTGADVVSGQTPLER